MKSLWRYRELLPVVHDQNIVTLGEGYTPIIPLKKTRKTLVKDDGLMPTGTFKARGLCVAVSKAKELGVKSIAIPSAGNAGGALACYAARAGMKAVIYMPADAPESNKVECKVYGATLILVEGVISDAARAMQASVLREGYFDVSTLKEPYRVEGKKTMGFEVAEQLGFSLPDVIIYPTGGGTGIVGMWKAFEELEELGWIGSERPRMISVQAEGCAPLAKAFREGREQVDQPYPRPQTLASGLRVPYPYASDQTLRVIRESRGTAVTVTDGEMINTMRKLAAQEGLLACPEGAATYAAYERMLDEGQIGKDELTLLYNTGTGLKYFHLL